MTKELSTTVSVADRISERIRAEFVSLISEEEWDALIQREVRSFTTPPERRYHSDTPALSPLGGMVREALAAVARERIAAEIDKLGNLQGPEGQDLVRQLVTECAAELLANAMAPVVSNALWNLRQQLQSQIQGL